MYFWLLCTVTQYSDLFNIHSLPADFFDKPEKLPEVKDEEKEEEEEQRADHAATSTVIPPAGNSNQITETHSTITRLLHILER